MIKQKNTELDRQTVGKKTQNFKQIIKSKNTQQLMNRSQVRRKKDDRNIPQTLAMNRDTNRTTFTDINKVGEKDVCNKWMKIMLFPKN